MDTNAFRKESKANASGSCHDFINHSNAGEATTKNMFSEIFSRRGFTVGAAALLAAGLSGFSGLFNTRTAFAEPTSAEKQAEADAVAAKLMQWEEELATASNNYYVAMDAHEAALVAMDEAQVRIDAAQLIIADTQIKLGARASSMYKSGPFSFLDVLFGATSFVEFTTRWDLLNGINRENAELIAQNKNAKQEAQTAHDEYSAQEQIAAEKLSEADQIRAGAEQTVAQYEAELSGLTAEVAALVEKEQEAERLKQAEEERKRQISIPTPKPPADEPQPWEPEPVVTTPVDPPAGANTIVAAAYSQLGVPYVWAGTTPGVGFDCSGLTQWCYAQAGISIPRTDGGQYGAASSILAVSDAAPGDILWMPGHVGIALGGGSYIHAPVPGRVVCIESYPMFYYALRF
jgi:cell wall-associated NlpC family hydrolase